MDAHSFVDLRTSGRSQLTLVNISCFLPQFIPSICEVLD